MMILMIQTQVQWLYRGKREEEGESLRRVPNLSSLQKATTTIMEILSDNYHVDIYKISRISIDFSIGLKYSLMKFSIQRAYIPLMIFKVRVIWIIDNILTILVGKKSTHSPYYCFSSTTIPSAVTCIKIDQSISFPINDHIYLNYRILTFLPDPPTLIISVFSSL